MIHGIAFWGALLLSAATPNVARGAAPAAVRLVSLAPSLTEIVYALGGEAHLVGVTRDATFPPAAQRLPQVGRFMAVNMEALYALQPTLVVAIASRAGQRALQVMERLHIPTESFADATLDDLQAQITRLGVILGRQTAATRLSQQLQKQLAQGCAVGTPHATLPAQLRVAVVVSHRPLMLAGPQSFYDQLLAWAGVRNALSAAAPMAQPFARIDREVLLQLDPDVIVDVTSEAMPELFWQQQTGLRALQQQRVHMLVDARLQRMGPRLAAGLRLLCTALQP